MPLDENIEKEMATLKFQKSSVNLLVQNYFQFLEEGSVEIVPKEVLNSKINWIMLFSCERCNYEQRSE